MLSQLKNNQKGNRMKIWDKLISVLAAALFAGPLWVQGEELQSPVSFILVDSSILPAPTFALASANIKPLFFSFNLLPHYQYRASKWQMGQCNIVYNFEKVIIFFEVHDTMFIPKYFIIRRTNIHWITNWIELNNL